MTTLGFLTRHSDFRKGLRRLAFWVALIIISGCRAEPASTPTSGPTSTPVSEPVLFPKYELLNGEWVRWTAATAGFLVEVDGCLRLKYSDGTSELVIWPPHYELDSSGDVLQIRDGGSGQVVARVGEWVVMGGGEGSHLPSGPAPITDETVQAVGASGCPGPYWIAGGVIPDSDYELYPTSTPNEYPPTDGEDRPIYEGDVLELDAQAYARDFGVTLEEALDRLRYQSLIGELGAELAEKEADTFAGLWIQNRPEYRYVVMFTRDGEEVIAPYIEGKPYEDLIEVREAEVTLVDLQELQEATWLELQEAGIPEREGLGVNRGIRIADNRVVLYVTDPAIFNAALEEAGVELSEHVTIVADGAPR